MSVDIDSNENEENRELTYEQWENTVNRQTVKENQINKNLFIGY